MEGGSFLVDVHIVQRGETLWKIARQHGISFEELKRVNAHLANPDYIVPGMKIFLPSKVQAKGESAKTGASETKVKKVESVKKVEKAPVAQPISLTEALQAPKEPMPIPATPKVPKVTSKPVEESIEAPPKATMPKVEQTQHKPTPAPTPPPAQAPMPPFPMQPYPYTVIGIPCGWLPIYDADCYPYVHMGQMHQMPHQPPMTQLPVPESTHFNHYRPSARPSVPEMDKKMESPTSKKDSTPGFYSPPAPPELHFPSLSGPELMPSIESPTLQLPKAKPEVKKEAKPKSTPMPESRPISPTDRGPMPAAPAPYSDWSYPQTMYPAHTGQSSPCGCSQLAPMPLPVQQHPFCNACNQPIGPHPMHPMPPMPYPAPYHWHGMY